MSNTKNILLIFSIIILTFCSSSKHVKNEVNSALSKVEIAEMEVFPKEEPTSLDLIATLMMEAKAHYADALIALHFSDSSAAVYEFEKTFQLLLEISEFELTSLDASEDFQQLTETIVTEYSESFQDSVFANFDFQSADLLNQIPSLETEDDFSDVGGIVVVDDREGHVPIIINKRVQRAMDYFQNKAHRDFQIWLDRSGIYKEMMQEKLSSENVPEELFYLALIESGLNPRAYSYAHAAGPWQFISATGKRYGLDRNYWVDERYDPELSTVAAARYLKDLFEEFDDWYLALASYNAGEGRIRRAIRREKTHDFWMLRSLPKQTRNYVPTYLAAVVIALDPEKYGFEIPQQKAWNYDRFETQASYDIAQLAQSLKLTTKEFKAMNPALRRWTTPPKSYSLRIPSGSIMQLEKKLESIEKQAVADVQYYRVRLGDSISRIATKFGTSQRSIVRINNLRNPNRIRVGQKLVIPVPGVISQPTTAQSSSKNRQIYVVKKGDTLSEIAQKHRTSVSNIRRWNNIRYGAYIYPGQKLSVISLQKQNPQADGKDYFVHIVRRGDTLWDISRTYNVPLWKLKKWNQQFASGRLMPGDNLKIYKEGSS